MIPYLLLLLFVTITAYAGRCSGDRVVRRASLVSVAAVLVAFAGLRDHIVGTDTGNYVRRFLASDSTAILFRDNEIGYNALSWFARSLSDSYAVLLTLIALIVVSCYVTTIVRVVRRYETALFVFITLGVYTFFFNGARQGIAAALCFLAIPFLLQRRLVLYVLLVIVAVLFHQTAVVALPLYYLASQEVRWRRLAMIGFATLVVVAFLQVFVNLAADLLDDKYAVYADAGEGGGKVWVAFLLGQGALLYFFKSLARESNGSYARLLNIYLVGLVPVLASTLSGINPSGLLRLHLYFSSTAILMWPMVFRQFGAAPLKGLLALGFFAGTITFFTLTTMSFSNLAPYRINSDIASW